MSKELIEEVHEEVDLKTADAQHHVLLRLCPVAAVVPPGLLPLHPQKGQLLELHPSHSTDGNWIKSDEMQGGARWCMERKQCLRTVQSFRLIRASVLMELR